MKKRFLSMVLLCALFFVLVIPVAAEEPTKEAAIFTVISIPYPGGEKLWEESYDRFSRLMARYADDQAPIPLSQYYDGYLFATVPIENASRKIEPFIAEDQTFSDYNETQYEYSQMMELSRRGLVKGNDKGELLPFQHISRAEAASLIVRLLGLHTPKSFSSRFKDVSSDAWFANDVATVEQYGIVCGDSDTTFSPNRNISREEFTVMVAHALWLADLSVQHSNITLEELNKKTSLQDAGSISSWAISAYDTIGNYSITDDVFSNTDGADDVRLYANPQKSTTRAEAAGLLFWS